MRVAIYPASPVYVYCIYFFYCNRKIEELDKSLDAPLRVLYMKQLLLLRDKALKRYKSSSKSSESSDYEAMIAADNFFGSVFFYRLCVDDIEH